MEKYLNELEPIDPSILDDEKDNLTELNEQ